MKRYTASFFPLILLSILGIGLVSALFSLNRQQQLRSNAAQVATCAPVPTQVANAPITGGTNTLTADTNTLRSQYSSFEGFNLRDKNALVPQMRDTANARKEKMLQGMRRRPETVLDSILKDQERAELASVTTNCIESLITTEGTLSIVHYDFDDNRTNEVYILTTPDKKAFEVFPAGDQTALQNNMRIRVEGYQLDTSLLVDTNDSTTITIIESGIANDIQSAQGQQQTAVILAYFSNTPQPTINATEARNALFTDTNNYFQETSYNKTSITGAGTPTWVQLSIAQTCDINAMTPIALNAASSSINLSQYTRFIIYAPFGNSCPWNGAGTIGKTGQLTLGGQPVNVSVSWINMTKYTGPTWLTRVVSHEFGHNLGIHHSTMSTCNCTLPEYGDPYTVMGKNQFGGGDQVIHMNAPHKEYIGWLTGTNVQTVTTNGTFTLQPIAATTNGVKAIKIPRGGGDFLYVEYRQAIGADTNIGDISGTDAYEGALLHTLIPFTQPATLKTELIDATAGTAVASALKVGSSYTDAVSGATLSVSNKSASGLTITVDFGGQTTPTPTSGSQPTPTVTPSVPTPTDDPINSPTPTVMTPTPTDSIDPCLSGTNCVQVGVSVKLHGIGSSGDNTNQNSTGNANPVRRTRIVMVEIYDNEEQYIGGEFGEVTYNESNGYFVGTIGLGNIPTDTPYIIKIWSDNYLTKRVAGIKTLSSTQVTNLPLVALTTGDINNNNVLDILDYNALLECYSGITQAKDCTGLIQLQEADLTDDGRVDQSDYNLFLRELLSRVGD